VSTLGHGLLGNQQLQPLFLATNLAKKTWPTYMSKWRISWELENLTMYLQLRQTVRQSDSQRDRYLFAHLGSDKLSSSCQTRAAWLSDS